MFHVMFQQATSYDVAILCKTEALDKNAILQHYINPMKELGFTGSYIGFSLEYDNAKKVKAAYAKDYLSNELLPELRELGVKVLYCTDGNYFKVLTKNTKAEPHYGYVVPCAIPGYESMQVVLSPNHRALFANDSLQAKIDLANSTLVSYLDGSYQEIGTGIIKSAQYIPNELNQVRQALASLHQYPALTCDIEAFSLRHYLAGIGTIAFAWNQHEGIAIDVEHVGSLMGFRGTQNSIAVKQLLKEFFESYQGKLIFHNATYDVKVLIYELWMKDLLDTEGLLEGLSVMTRDFEDTKIIAYLATNSCAGNSLSLKELAHEYAGNYAQSDIHDITLITSKNLLKYNLVDCLSTWFVFNKYEPMMIADDQQQVYIELFKPMLIKVIQMELTGMPLNMVRVREVDSILKDTIDSNFKLLNEAQLIKDFSKHMRTVIADKRNQKYKKKRVTADEVEYQFNPNSNDQLIELLHTYLGFEVYSTTPSGQPAVGGDELKGHLARSPDPQVKEAIGAILAILDAAKIKNTFVAKYLESPEFNGWHYLFGSFIVGGTISGRISSNSPNLMNQPSKGKMGKLIKSCFQAPKGKLFVCSDFSGLEDMVNTLLTHDPNKMKVFLNGFDGHSMRARAFFANQLSHIDPEDSIAVNAIKTDYPDLRSNAKSPHFALQYGGSWKTLQINCGFSEAESKEMERNYHQLYKASDDWVQTKLEQASIDGYTTLAFGLRLRTPILAKTILGTFCTPFQAASESRSAGNAVSGQSYGLLNSRAGVEFHRRVLASPYRLDIQPIAEIHDALYYVISDRIEVVEWVNTNLIDCMRWQELPELQHDAIKLNSELDICYPTWADPITIPNDASAKEIYDLCRKTLKER